jgi:hypothetical protein
MVEEWSDGRPEWWSDGKLEWWNTGFILKYRVWTAPGQKILRLMRKMVRGSEEYQ